MSRDVWILKRQSIKTDKLRKYLEIPAFSYTCWYPRQSLKTIDGAAAPNKCFCSFIDDFYKTAFTIEFWAYTNISMESDNCFLIAIGATPIHYAAVYLSGYYPGIQVTKAGISQSITTSFPIPTGTWFHIACTYDGTRVRVYINGILRATSGLIMAPLDSNPFNNLSVLSDNVGALKFYGYVDEIRILDTAKSEADIKLYMDKHCYPGDSIMKFYYNMDDATDNGTLLTIPNDVSGVVVGELRADSGLSVELSTTNSAPIVLGSSFVVAEFATSLGRYTSLKYPVEMPADASNFGLYVSWIDDDGNFQRRKLFAPSSGIKLAPNPADYAGEKMNTGFKFEIVNVDGEDTVSLGSTLTIELSHTSNPASGTDHTQVEAAELTADTTLAENFPFGSGTLNFNTQQTY